MKILVVDDNQEGRYMLETLLRGDGFEVTTASDGAEALKEALEDGFDVIIADTLMPRMDGFQLCREVKTNEQLKHIAFVFYTATYTDPQDEAFALSLGAETFIVKPTEPDVFIEILREVIRSHESGRLVAPQPPVAEEAVYLQEYNARLIGKLEDKLLQLERMNKNLRQSEQELTRHREHLEELVEERARQLVEANEELESFVYAVSHDLRAPLRGIQGFAQILLRDYAERLDADGQHYAQRIIESAEQMDTLIQDLLAHSHLSRTELHLQPVDLTPVVAEVLAQLQTELQERAALVTVKEPLPQVRGHRATLVQVVANLLTNAVKFVRPGVQPRVRIWAEEREERIRLWVEDNGIGIALEQQERIFRVFERLHGIETYPGTGIGLAIVRKGVARMGGRVGVESTPGQGSKFWVEMPKAENVP
jgi:signal transduction histidine kinase